jgi:hypothetical protein
VGQYCLEAMGDNYVRLYQRILSAAP